jgi:hypothetical protein
VTGQEIRAATDGLLRSAFGQAVGSRPRRCQPASGVLDQLCLLANESVVRNETAPGEWRVVEGRRWLLNRRLDGRLVPLVQREQVAVVVRSWAEARTLATLLNWCDAPAPPRQGAGMPRSVPGRTR